MKRREFLRLSSGALAASWVFPFASNRTNKLRERLHHAQPRIVPADPAGPADRIEIVHSWDGDFCRAKVVNRGQHAVRLKEVVLCEASLDLPAETRLYGESFQMLSQTAGTLSHPEDLGYSELRHYRIPQPEDAVATTGLLALSPPEKPSLVLGFSSCRRFIGRFFLKKDSIQVVVDTEGLTLAPERRGSWKS